MKKNIIMSLVIMAGIGLMACSSASKENDKSILIGGIGPLTGGAASYGTSVMQGLEIAVSEINEAGGVKIGNDTYKLNYSFKDDEAMEDKAVTAYNALVDEKIDVLVGAVTSGASLAITDLSKKDNILQLTPTASAKDVTVNDNVFRLCFTDPLQGELIADHIVKKGYESVAILYNNSDEYSIGINEAFKNKLKDLGKDIIVAEESFATGDIDFLAQLTKIKTLNPEVIFIPAYYEAVSQILAQAKSVDIKADYIGTDGWDGILSQVTDVSSLEGALFLSPFLATDESENIKKFVKSYQEKYKSSPDQFAADGYDSVYVIKEAIEKANSLDTDKLLKAMTEIRVDGLTGSISFGADGEPNKSAKFIGIENGKYVQK